MGMLALAMSCAPLTLPTRAHPPLAAPSPSTGGSCVKDRPLWLAATAGHEARWDEQAACSCAARMTQPGCGATTGRRRAAMAGPWSAWHAVGVVVPGFAAAADTSPVPPASRRRCRPVPGMSSSCRCPPSRPCTRQKRDPGWATPAGQVSQPGACACAHTCAMPPSTNSSMPLMKLAWSDARKATALATSCGSPRRSSGTCAASWSNRPWRA